MADISFSGIRIRYDDFVADVRRMSVLAEPFLKITSPAPFERLKTLAENLRNAAPGVRQHLAIPDEQPISTKTSDSYRGVEQNIAVRGELSFIWEIANCSGGKKRRTEFDLIGIASTRIRIFANETELVAHWQMEAGDDQSPGCHFHSSVNQGGDNGLFPKWLKIPRLPGLLLSPMDALEFLLGELFQVKWEQHVSKESDHRNGWAKSQLDRLTKILQWQQEAARAKRFGTPWMNLKKAKPPVNVLMVD